MYVCFLYVWIVLVIPWSNNFDTPILDNQDLARFGQVTENVVLNLKLTDRYENTKHDLSVLFHSTGTAPPTGFHFQPPQNHAIPPMYKSVVRTRHSPTSRRAHESIDGPMAEEQVSVVVLPLSIWSFCGARQMCSGKATKRERPVDPTLKIQAT